MPHCIAVPVSLCPLRGACRCVAWLMHSWSYLGQTPHNEYGVLLQVCCAQPPHRHHPLQRVGCGAPARQRLLVHQHAPGQHPQAHAGAAGGAGERTSHTAVPGTAVLKGISLFQHLVVHGVAARSWHSCTSSTCLLQPIAILVVQHLACTVHAHSTESSCTLLRRC